MKMVKRAGRAEVLWVGALVIGGGGLTVAFATLPSTINDFFIGGTQPSTLTEPLAPANSCRLCHEGYDEAHEPWTRWAASMMGQATRDPIFWACLSIANQDAAGAGDMCLRCHTPEGWLDGRSTPTDGSALVGADFSGVSCSVCHRMVDPEYQAGVSPPEDLDIINNLTDPPVNPHSGSYVMDPQDRRRGPFQLDKMFWHQWIESPFHQSSSMCATCHDVSNPMYTAQPDGSYALNTLGEEHPTGDKYDMFPMERTWSEWSQSAFAQGPIDMGGRFGGNNPEVSSCQDCHMPDSSGYGARPDVGAVFRDDLPQHNFNGANSWVLRAVRSLHADGETGLTEASVNDSIARNIGMLQAAADMEATQRSSDIGVRVVNMTGHKLPTGYVEGRRMWLNVQYFDSSDTLIDERGHYDGVTADLTTADTKVYEAKMGLDAAAALATGLPEGEGFHFAVNNTYLLDNRIPPMGFTNAGFEAVQAQPIAYDYADGQYWDDTGFDVPFGAVRAEVRLYHQTTTKEYIEFLRDENTTDSNGQIAYDQWVLHGKSAPVEMAMVSIDLGVCPADLTDDGILDIFDVLAFINAFQAGGLEADWNADGFVDIFDVTAYLGDFSAGC